MYGLWVRHDEDDDDGDGDGYLGGGLGLSLICVRGLSAISTTSDADTNTI